MIQIQKIATMTFDEDITNYDALIAQTVNCHIVSIACQH